jgi:putative transposase
MPEHFHLLMSEPQVGTPSTVLQALKIGFARRVLIRERVPHVSGVPQLVPRTPKLSHIWQRRFYDFNVWTEAKRIEKLRYIHRNPVTRGLVEQPEQWRWSSFRAYAYGETGPVRVNDCHVLEMRLRSVG